MCGFVGIIGVERASAAAAQMLQALQHRGQDACGVGSVDQGRVHLVKDLGMVSQVLSMGVIATLPGEAAIGHVRYPTVGAGVRDDAQPFHTRRPGVLMAHNGNVTNVPELEAWLRRRGVRVQSGCDVEPIMLVFAEALGGSGVEHVKDAVRAVFDRVRGAYTCAAVLEVDGRDTLVAFRDPYGVRPGVYGQSPQGAWCVASESVALDAMDFAMAGEIPPGAVMLFRPGEPPRVEPIATATPRRCLFERIYFARPDSKMEDGRVFHVRWALGERLGKEWRERGLEADVVVPVPDTSRPAAQAMAEALGLPFREGFIKNRYSGRTFIMPDQRSRQSALRLKLNPIPEILEGKRVILVDDSVVRGTTVKRLAELVRSTRPAAVHLAIFSPPVRHPCYYGIDMPSRDELVAAKLPESEWARAFGVDSVTFLSVEGLRATAGSPACMACFDGDYPVPVSEREKAAIVADRRGAPG
ncbi:MAG: amidophosphoribosyltransferase [Deltaproteobacteria bacterium]|nr:amidophosphoribosyltransferase [Deltaproteobacteria bacterium]